MMNLSLIVHVYTCYPSASFFRRNILLNYAVLYNDYGYSQGMSDLVAPILAEFQNEPETFWCFVSLMKRCLFVCTPTDSDMEKNLVRYSFNPFKIQIQPITSHLRYRFIFYCSRNTFVN